MIGGEVAPLVDRLKSRRLRNSACDFLGSSVANGLETTSVSPTGRWTVLGPAAVYHLSGDSMRKRISHYHTVQKLFP